MLRELRGSNVSLTPWADYLEQKVRPTIGVTLYGDGRGEYTRKYNKLLQDFEAVIRAELEISSEDAP
jgi:hypothetical protein